MNKYKTQETFCYSFITLWVLGIILIMATSCSTMETAYKVDYNKVLKNKNKYEWACADFTK